MDDVEGYGVILVGVHTIRHGLRLLDDLSTLLVYAEIRRLNKALKASKASHTILEISRRRWTQHLEIVTVDRSGSRGNGISLRIVVSVGC